jgi:hypothetical protein
LHLNLVIIQLVVVITITMRKSSSFTWLRHQSLFLGPPPNISRINFVRASRMKQIVWIAARKL